MIMMSYRENGALKHQLTLRKLPHCGNSIARTLLLTIERPVLSILLELITLTNLK